MNDVQRTGFRRAVDAAWEYLPQVILFAIGAIVAFLFGLWSSYGSLRVDVDRVISEQSHGNLCQRISSCSLCEKLSAGVIDAKLALVMADQHIESHNREAEQWKQRIINVERQLFEIGREKK